MHTPQYVCLAVGALLGACRPATAPVAGDYQDPPPPPPLEAEGTAAARPDIDLPYEAFTLDNGLRVVVHTDRKAPVVAVSIWYHVGSKNEVPGKTGFAHLFEHLMFNGTENFDGEFFEPLESVGATDVNGTTWFDRTNYFQTVPRPALELALWLESDRMGHLLGAVTQKKLDNQRGVVQNEKRQGDNEPFGTVEYRLLQGMYPEGHPYRWSTIGSMEDLDAASLDDVKAWFQRYYGPNNAVLVLAGDIDAATAQPLVAKYFGDIPPGPPLYGLQRWVPTRKEDIRESMRDRVAHPRLYRNWVVPPRTERDAHLLRVVAEVLGGGKSSRLHRALVYEAQLASAVRVEVELHELASVFQIQVDVKQGIDPAQVERLLDAELERFLRTDPTADEVIRARASINSRSVRGLERVGGFSGKAPMLAQGALYADDPGFWQTALGWMNEAQQRDLLTVARDWLGRGFYQLSVHPYGRPAATQMTDASVRSNMPQVSTTPDIDFPTIERGTLANGISVVLARRTAIPAVQVGVQFDAGFAADPTGMPGLASFALDVMDEGTETRDALTIAAELDQLGASLTAASDLDTSRVGISTLKRTLQPAVALLADVLQNPAFASGEIERVRKQRLEAIAKEMVSPVGLALRFLPPLLYGEGHPYAIPFSGTGTAEVVQSITRNDLLSFRNQWLRPDNVTVFVAGDITLSEVIPLLNQSLGLWAPPPTNQGVKPKLEPTTPKAKVVLIDRPGSPQSLILAGHLAPPTGVSNNLAIEAMNDALGGKFTARLNMNLRESKGWAYGAYTFMQDARGPRPFMIYAPVQTDKTAPSMREIARELKSFLSNKPVTRDEFDRVVKSRIRRLPGSYETTGSVLQAMLENARFDRPDDYVATLSDAYRALTRNDAESAARQVVRPGALVWLVVGDRAKIESKIRGLGLGPLEVMDVDASANQ